MLKLKLVLAGSLLIAGAAVAMEEEQPSKEQKREESGQEASQEKSDATKNLMNAVKKGDVAAIREAILNGANPNIPALNPLAQALWVNNYDLAEFLLDHGARLDQHLPNPEWGTVGGMAQKLMNQNQLSRDLAELVESSGNRDKRTQM